MIYDISYIYKKCMFFMINYEDIGVLNCQPVNSFFEKISCTLRGDGMKAQHLFNEYSGRRRGGFTPPSSHSSKGLGPTIQNLKMLTTTHGGKEVTWKTNGRLILGAPGQLGRKQHCSSFLSGLFFWNICHCNAKSGVFNIFFLPEKSVRSLITVNLYEFIIVMAFQYDWLMFMEIFIGIVSSFISNISLFFHCFPSRFFLKSWFHAITEATRLANIVRHRLGGRHVTPKTAQCKRAESCKRSWLWSASLAVVCRFAKVSILEGDTDSFACFQVTTVLNLLFVSFLSHVWHRDEKSSSFGHAMAVKKLTSSNWTWQRKKGHLVTCKKAVSLVLSRLWRSRLEVLLRAPAPTSGVALSMSWHQKFGTSWCFWLSTHLHFS